MTEHVSHYRTPAAASVAAVPKAASGPAHAKFPAMQARFMHLQRRLAKSHMNSTHLVRCPAEDASKEARSSHDLHVLEAQQYRCFRLCLLRLRHNQP